MMIKIKKLERKIDVQSEKLEVFNKEKIQKTTDRDEEYNN